MCSFGYTKVISVPGEELMTRPRVLAAYTIKAKEEKSPSLNTRSRNVVSTVMISSDEQRVSTSISEIIGRVRQWALICDPHVDDKFFT